MTIIQKAGAPCDSVPSTGNTSLIVQLTRGFLRFEEAPKSKIKPSCSSTLLKWILY
jgi:hypothetical protein